MIEIDVSNKDPNYSVGSLHITLDESYPPQLWELLEDAIADRLAHMNLNGSIESSVTGNITTIKKIPKGDL